VSLKIKMSVIKSFRDLIVYQKSYKLALEIFEITKTFPKEEMYSLTDQIRRSSRSVPANIVEAWPKRKYIKLFTRKLIDAAGESAETEFWLDMSYDNGYISEEIHMDKITKCQEIGKMLNSMINNPEKFCQ